MAMQERKAHPVNKLTAPAVRRLGAGMHADDGGLYLQQIAITLNQAAGLRVRAAGERQRNLPQGYGKLL